MVIARTIKMMITAAAAMLTKNTRVDDVGSGVGDGFGVVNCIVTWWVLNCVVYHT